MKTDTLRKLREIRLSSMADAYERQMEQPDRFSQLTFDERFAMLVDHEYDNRHNNHLTRLLKNAHLL